MRCKNCGKKLRAKEKFCTVCGYYNTTEEENANSINFSSDNSRDLADDNIKAELPPHTQDEETIDTEEFSLKADASGTKENEFYYKDEKFLEAYIGEDYKLIKKSPFNIYAFLLNWMYILYRKMYLIGIIGLLITWIIIKLNPKNLLIYAIIAMVLIGLFFNKLYIFVSKLKVEYLLKKNRGTDNFTMENICAKKGGVNVRNALLIYLVFLVIIFFSFFRFSYISYNEKFWKENSENQATCISLVKIAYKDLDKNPVTGTIVEAACNIDKSSKTEYNVYLKLQNNTNLIYVYYKTENDSLILFDNTEDITSLETKNINQTISAEETEKLQSKKQILENYLTTSKKASEEDKLIKEKRNTSQRLNYIFSKEEIIR